MTAAAALRLAADTVRQGGDALNLMARMFGQPPLRTPTLIEGDLRMLAVWLDEHPDIDAQMSAVLDTVEHVIRRPEERA